MWCSCDRPKFAGAVPEYADAYDALVPSGEDPQQSRRKRSRGSLRLEDLGFIGFRGLGFRVYRV